MTEPRFFAPAAALDLGRILELTGAAAPAGLESLTIEGVAPAGRAGPRELALFDAAAAARLAGRALRAGAILLPPSLAPAAPRGPVALVAADPAAAYAAVAAALFPSALRPQPLFRGGVAAGAVVHPEARLEQDVSIDPGAVIGPGVEIGCGASIGAGAVIGAGVRIGRGAVVGAGASVQCALLGDHVMIRSGARIGEDGAGQPRIRMGRAIIQDRVEIGANSVVERGSDTDTVIGEASRIDNLVHIGHNVVIGRRCVLLSGARVASGAALDDFTVVHSVRTTPESDA